MRMRMGPIGHQRIAQRFPVATTPIEWKVPKRRNVTPRSRTAWAEAAIIELSVMGAAIVAPVKWRPIRGSKVEVRWEGRTGIVVVRREAPFPGSTTMALYGVEYADNHAALALDLFERLVVQAAMAATARDAEMGRVPAPIPDLPAPGIWEPPVTWTTEPG